MGDQLSPGESMVSLTVEVGLDANNLRKPTSFAPDFYLGVNPRSMVGLVSSNGSRGQLVAGNGLCTRGDLLRCRSDLRGLAAELRREIYRSQSAAIVAVSRLGIKESQPFMPQLAMGVLATKEWGRLSFVAAPTLVLGLAEQANGNPSSGEAVLSVWLRGRADVGLLVPTRFAFRDGVDAARIGLGLALRVNLHRTFAVDARIGLINAFGPQNTLTDRAASLGLVWQP